LTAHLRGILVGVEAGKQMDNVSEQSHDGFDPGSFQRRFVEGTICSNDTQPSLGAGVRTLDICLAAERVDQGLRFFGSKANLLQPTFVNLEDLADIATTGAYCA
jgi:hypothetical protein